MNIEEAIEKLKETAKQCRNSKECWENEDCCDCYVEVEDIFAIETVLKELEEQTEANKELNKVLIHFKAIINEMADYIAELDVDEDICKNIEHCASDKKLCRDCIKEYFYKKVSDNK